MKFLKLAVAALFALTAAFFCLAGLAALRYGVLWGVAAVLLGGAMMVGLVLWWFLRRRFPRLCEIVSRVVTVLFLIAFAISTVASVQIASRYNDEVAPPEAVMVVLGCGLSRVDGVTPSLVMHRRLVAAEAYLKAHPKTVCVLSGGQGPNENITEAQAMFTFLVERGIEPERLFMEEASTNTRENLSFSRDLMLENDLISDLSHPKLIVVTDGFHEFRAQSLARELGFESYTVSAKSPRGLVLLYWLREIPGIVTQVWL